MLIATFIRSSRILGQHEDRWCVAIDQGQIESRVIAMASRDRHHCTYTWDRHDIHQDWALKLAHAYPSRIGGKKFLNDKTVVKKFRDDIKNQWTFPLFFGANLWSASNYIKIPVNVLKPYYEEFWEEFEGVQQWQEELFADYEKNGYVECLTGRRRVGPIRWNEVINAPVQGTASDITVDAWTRLSEAAQELGMWQFAAKMEIHDELVFWVPKKTFDRDLEFIADFLLECKHYDFICVPLCIEIGRGPNWFEQDHVSTLYSDDFGKINRVEQGF